MEREQPSRFFILDDEAVWLHHLTSALSPFGEVTRAERIVEALATIEAERPFSGYVLDLSLPDGSGFEVLEAVRARSVEAPALILTSHHQREQINRAHGLGAEFVCKPPEVRNLASFARRCIAFEWTGSRRVAELADVFAGERQFAPREVQILSAAVAGLQRRVVAERLGVSENTLKVQIRTVLGKCGVSSLDELSSVVLRRALGAPASQKRSGSSPKAASGGEAPSSERWSSR